MELSVYKPVCENPILLVNRAATNLIYRGGQLYINNVKSNFINKGNFNCYPVKPLFDIALKLTYKQLHTCFVRLGDVVECLFVFAPCGHCDLCRSKRQTDYVWRASMESACYDVPCYFFTLTYAPKYLPTGGELLYSDFQKFMKRLRMYWSRQGIENNVRYFVAGEYGSNPNFSHRPHFHVLLWNNPLRANQLDPVKHRQLKMDIFRAWGKCELQAFDFSECGNGAARYCAKYVTKPSQTYGHMHKPFVRASRGDGGIGYPLIKQLIPQLHKTPWVSQLEFRDFNGNIQRVAFGSYVSRKVYPAPSSVVPYRLRQAYKELSDNLHFAASLGFYSPSQVKDILERLLPSPNVSISRYNPSDIKRITGHCSLYIIKQAHVLFAAIQDNMEILAETYDVPQSYIDVYYQHKSYMPKQSDIDIANKLLRTRDNIKIQQLKEKL